MPFGEPPLGFYRFRVQNFKLMSLYCHIAVGKILKTFLLQSAVPKEPWGVMREAKKPGPECLQLSTPKVLRIVGKEGTVLIQIRHAYYYFNPDIYN